MLDNNIINLLKNYSYKTKGWKPFNEDEEVWWENISDEGYCYLASYNLYRKLKELNYNVKIIQGICNGIGHFWVSIYTDQEYWLDPTYYQFEYTDDDNGKLYATARTMINHGYHKTGEIYTQNDLKQLRNYINYTIGNPNLIKYKV